MLYLSLWIMDFSVCFITMQKIEELAKKLYYGFFNIQEEDIGVKEYSVTNLAIKIICILDLEWKNLRFPT